ncbi:hypothetical protein KW803_01910 [Candidatus Saccharibacteria bacterium]|nr:hypothetical protein [Candidatus Saccharibacteria bacterium]
MARNWKTKTSLVLSLAILLSCLSGAYIVQKATALTTQTGSVGVEGKVPGPPPSQAPTITVPSNGQSFSSLPITVSGFCVNNTLVEVFKNNVFAGSTPCSGNSYRLQIDLFDGRNDLVARELDDLNQSSPDSNIVTVNFSTPLPSIGPRISLTSEYAKRGANPGTILSWPVTLSGGSGPYAISVDWGDKSKADLISQQLPGLLNLQHTYAQAGVYNVLIRASDANGNVAFLQVVGIGNGPIKQAGTNTSNGIISTEKTIIIWWPMVVLFIFMFIAFYIGRKNQVESIRRKLRQGDDSFDQ